MSSITARRGIGRAVSDRGSAILRETCGRSWRAFLLRPARALSGGRKTASGSRLRPGAAGTGMARGIPGTTMALPLACRHRHWDAVDGVARGGSHGTPSVVIPAEFAGRRSVYSGPVSACGSGAKRGGSPSLAALAPRARRCSPACVRGRWFRGQGPGCDAAVRSSPSNIPWVRRSSEAMISSLVPIAARHARLSDGVAAELAHAMEWSFSCEIIRPPQTFADMDEIDLDSL